MICRGSSACSLALGLSQVEVALLWEAHPGITKLGSRPASAEAHTPDPGPVGCGIVINTP